MPPNFPGMPSSVAPATADVIALQSQVLIIMMVMMMMMMMMIMIIMIMMKMTTNGPLLRLMITLA